MSGFQPGRNGLFDRSEYWKLMPFKACMNVVDWTIFVSALQWLVDHLAHDADTAVGKINYDRTAISFVNKFGSF